MLYCNKESQIRGWCRHGPQKLVIIALKLLQVKELKHVPIKTTGKIKIATLTDEQNNIKYDKMKLLQALNKVGKSNKADTNNKK